MWIQRLPKASIYMTGVPEIEPQTSRSQIQHLTTQPRTPQRHNLTFTFTFTTFTILGLISTLIYLLLQVSAAA